ncbi:MAG: ABC transporter substrate-binding protein [Gallionella sp.]
MKIYITFFSTLLALGMPLFAAAQDEPIVLAVPGPGSLAFLPVHLAKAIAADRDQGLALKLRYFNGGPLAMRDLMNNNSDFVAIGLPAVAAGRANGMPVVAIGQLSQSAMFVLLLRSKLKNQVHNIAQLKGMRIGTSSGTTSERSMGQMITEYLIQRAGLKSSDVQFISSGQNRESQRAALTSATVDALMGDEPFASELVAQGVAVRLVDLYSPKQSNNLLGGPIVRAALATREDIYMQRPATVKKVQRMFDLALQWLSTHSAQEVADKLAGQPGFDASRSKLLAEILQRDPGIFPKRLAWDAQALAITEGVFHDVAASPEESQLLFSSFVR